MASCVKFDDFHERVADLLAPLLVRVFWTCGIWLLRRLPVQFVPAKSREYLYERMPIGQNPFDYTYTFKTSVGFSDADYNLHLSNSAYGKVRHSLFPFQSSP